jgi:multidrug resistance efflux pump
VIKSKAAWLLIGTAIVVLLGVFLLKKPAAEYYVLKRTDVDYTILASCTVSFPEPYEMAAKAEGDVKRIEVSEGQKAKKGALLIQVDDFKERRNLTIAENNYENTKLKMINAKEETYPRLKEQLNDAGSVLADAQNHADRIQVLFAAGAVSKVEMENARTKLEAAQAKFNQARLQLDSYAKSGAAAPPTTAPSLKSMSRRAKRSRPAKGRSPSWKQNPGSLKPMSTRRSWASWKQACRVSSSSTPSPAKG